MKGQINDYEIAKEQIYVQRQTITTRPEVFKLLEISASYSELFADLVAFAYTQDPWAIYRAVRIPDVEVAQKVTNPKYRRFDYRMSEFKQNKITDQHDQLDLFRHHLWKYFLSDPVRKRRLDIIIPCVLSAMSEMLQNQISGQTASTVTAVQTNRDIIAIFDQLYLTKTSGL